MNKELIDYFCYKYNVKAENIVESKDYNVYNNNENTIVIGDLVIDLKEYYNDKPLAKMVIGNVNIPNLESYNTQLFEEVTGNLIFDSLKIVTNKIVSIIGKEIWLVKVIESKSKIFDRSYGKASLYHLINISEKIADRVDGELSLQRLVTSNCKLLDKAGKRVSVESLKYINTKLFDEINGQIWFESLETCSVKLFDKSEGEVVFHKLENCFTKLFDTARNVQFVKLKINSVKLFDECKYIHFLSLEESYSKLFNNCEGVSLRWLKKVNCEKLFDNATEYASFQSLEKTDKMIFESVGKDLYINSKTVIPTVLIETFNGNLHIIES